MSKIRLRKCRFSLSSGKTNAFVSQSERVHPAERTRSMDTESEQLLKRIGAFPNFSLRSGEDRMAEFMKAFDATD